MKKTITLLLACLTILNLSVMAQDSREFPTIYIPNSELPSPISEYGKLWRNHLTFYNGEQKNTLLRTSTRLEQINGKQYVPAEFILVPQTYSYSTIKNNYSGIPQTLYYRQEGNKIYCLSDVGEELLLFDFGLDVGDNFQLYPGGEVFTVVETGSFPEYEKAFYPTGSIHPHMLRLKSETGKEDVWIEGVGSVNWGIISPLIPWEEMRGNPVEAQLYQVSNMKGEYFDYMADINKPDYKITFFELPEQEAESNKMELNYAFSHDTLCISGIYQPQSTFGPECIECKITEDNTIAFAFYGVHVITTSKFRELDVRIPGFKPGKYTIWGTDGPKTYVCQGKQDDYVPFVEKWKKWHVLGFSVGPYISKTDYFFQHEEVSIGEHTYMPLYSEDKTVYQGFDKEAKHLEGFFREEDRRVYRYDEETAQEYCVYDFTLEVGDTFNIDIEHEANLCVVTKVDYMNVKDKYLKTITFSSVNLYNESQMAHVNHTWVEGFGDTSNPTFGWIPNTNYLADPAWSSFNVAYMVCYNQPFICPLSIFGSCGGGISVIGQELVSGEGLSWEEYKEKYQGKPLLDYEITGGQLHVKGYMWLASCSPYYIYCKLSPTEEPWTYKISLAEEVMDEATTCMSTPYAVDLYFDYPPLKDDTCNYDKYRFLYDDEEGEHEVFNRDVYRPFIEEGKVWKTGWVSLPQSPARKIDIYYLGGDTIIHDQAYRKLMRTNVTKERKVTVYNGALREEGKKVYYSGGLLYDFGANIGDTLDVYPFMGDIKVIIDKREMKDCDGYLLKQTSLAVYGIGEDMNLGVMNHDAWYEGIGYLSGPCEGPDPGWPTGMYYNRLLSCSVGDEILFHSNTWTEDVSEYWLLPGNSTDGSDSEARKEKIDFTHVIKTRPTGPAYAPGIGLIWGEYDNAVLSIDFANMTGVYIITIRHDDEGQERYAETCRADILRTLDVNLMGYPLGQYTINVENEEEAYTSHFALPLVGNGIEPVREAQGGATSHEVFDLSGRRMTGSSLGRGIYIHDRKKVVR